MSFLAVAALAALAGSAQAQTFRRLGGCPTLGCIFPPDQANFIPGGHFDLRLEVHAPLNGSEAFNGGTPDRNFTIFIGKQGQTPVPAQQFFATQQQPALEQWSFNYYEDLYAEAAKRATRVNVASRAYRYVSINEPGTYIAQLRYYNGTTTNATWHVVSPPTPRRRAKNVIFFIGDGMTTNMITAARLIGHPSVNGIYQSKLALDTMEYLGHSMTHSLDTFITDSANSATALYTGHKSSVDALGVYGDSSPSTLDDPKVETIVELFKSLRRGTSQVGIVSTAFLADATPAALTAHTRQRGDYQTVLEQYLYGVGVNYTWTNYTSPDYIAGAGAENFLKGGSISNSSFYSQFASKGYQVLLNQTSLMRSSNTTRTLAVMCQSNLNKWLDRNVYRQNLIGMKNDPAGGSGDALDQAGLLNMTIKAIDVLNARDTNKDGFFLMSEAASIDKMMHVLDYDRALGELLELDQTVNATMRHLRRLGIENDTLIVVTADHGHGFDVFGNADTRYLADAKTDRQKRQAIGNYERSGLATGQYIAVGSNAGFPTNWNPRYTLAQGFGAHPDVREDYSVKQNVTGGSRLPAVASANGTSDYIVNPRDSPNGFVTNGTLPVSAPQGVHSLTDVPVYATGPGAELFSGTMNNIEVFQRMVGALQLRK
ncbi:hypothetical protein PYCC9005_003051 [Savitreella phatthalungensis]